MTSPHNPQVMPRPATVAQWAPGLLVALAAGVATAHGIYEVAAAAGTPKPIAWLYPLITDGLALVAYASTSRLSGGGRAYAWAVVVLAAGVSGLAQAVFLAGGDVPALDNAAAVAEAAAPPTDGAHRDVPAPLRFGVGAWPAIAAAIVAHLLFMLGEARTPSKPTRDTPADRADRPAAPAAASKPPASTGAERERLNGQPPVQPSTRPAVQPTSTTPVQPAGLPPAASPASHKPTAADADPAEQRPRARVQAVPSDTSSSPQKDRARAAAREHLRRTGHLPTVTALMDLADVSRGTAGTALQQLREQPADLHIVTPDEHLRTTS